MTSEVDALRAEIAELAIQTDRARTELYMLNLGYAASHFKVQSVMRASNIERLHHLGADAEASVIERRCQQLEESIRHLKEILSTGS